MLKRRTTIALGLGAATVALMPRAAVASAFDAAVESFTHGAPLGQGGLTITTPGIAENGNAVPIELEAAGAEEIALFAPANPVPAVARFRFGPAAGTARTATRIRLAMSQELLAIARMTDGSFVQAVAAVEVTVGGCAE